MAIRARNFQFDQHEAKRKLEKQAARKAQRRARKITRRG